MANPIKSAMAYLGLIETEEYVETPQRPQATEAPAPRAQVTPIRRTAAKGAVELNEIMTVRPRQYREAQIIAEHFREGVPVIMNLTDMSDAEAQKLIDFSSGLVMGLQGSIERVTPKVFLISPAYVSVSGESSAPEEDLREDFFAEN